MTQPDYLDDIKPLEDQQLGDEAIREALAKLHARECPITSNGRNNLLNLMTIKYGLLGQDARQEWVGPLVAAEAGDPELAKAMLAMRPHLQVKDQSASIDKDATLAGLFNHVVDVCASLAVSIGTAADTQQVVDAVHSLTGGLKFPAGVTQQDLEDARDSHTASLAAKAKRDAVEPYAQELRELAQAKLDAVNATKRQQGNYDDPAKSEADYRAELLAAFDNAT